MYLIHTNKDPAGSRPDIGGKKSCSLSSNFYMELLGEVIWRFSLDGHPYADDAHFYVECRNTEPVPRGSLDWI